MTDANSHLTGRHAALLAKTLVRRSELPLVLSSACAVE
jgi:hypothetical protein